MQLGVGDGTVRGWKAKDYWEKQLNEEVIKSDSSALEPELLEAQQEHKDGSERDNLFFDAVQIVVDTQQASTSLLQRRLRIGHIRAARLIDKLEQSNYVGPYRVDKPREVLIKELSPVLLMVLNENNKGTERKEQNAP
ncbi:hypothetical protein OB236_14385 [Paenibacillus sp. WQ 127069]|uniref:FtsK gamma domain-containing protein n=1 Tax=Paenibacillus baimaensis TaxID=2982185 RepID=A0ABT2UGY4_9BACL|nr:DNA translocase FtsK [Paenibacillus sp. WQ 127069]MCU6793301.1 hypothetical protein [Paenibacillus sp. WQ 127069]